MKPKNKVFKFNTGAQSALIQKAINKAGSLRLLSKELNIPKGSVSSYKSEKYFIPYPRLIRLLAFLNVQIEDVSDSIVFQLPSNWGQKLGAYRSLKSNSKKQITDFMSYVRSFKKRKDEIIPDFPITPKVCEFYGILMGDGCVSKYCCTDNSKRLDVVVTGDKRYELDYYLFIKRLVDGEFGVHSAVYRYKNNNTIRLIIRNKPFANYLLKLGFPQGNKYEHLKIPSDFLKLEWNCLRNLVRGLFDTDGSIYAKKNENYRYPYVSFSSKSKVLLGQLRSILRSQGYPFYCNNQNLVMKGIKNIKRWMIDVGSSNPKHSFKYRYWLLHDCLPARLR